MRTSASGSGSTPPDLDGDYPRRGSVVADTFRLDALIGEGPSGAVYNAWHLHEHRAYAVKVLHPDLGALTAALVRLRHDNQAIERLRHPHLGAAQALAGHDPPVLQRLLLPSESLRARLELGPLPLGEVARLFFALCGALEAAARVGVVHGDLKPENVLLLPPPGRMGEPVPQIIDFGLCHLRDREGGIGSLDYRRDASPSGRNEGSLDYRRDASPSGRNEGSHPLLGTVGYLAPEQIQGDGAALDGRADVFALGALLFECLTGRAAFDGATPAITVAKICLGERPRPSALAPGLPPALDDLFERACHRQAEERLPSPRALWTALHAAIGGEEEVRAALREAASPSPPSGRIALLPAGEEADGAAPGGDFAPGAASTVSLWPREGRRRGPRRPSGAQAIRLFKELEAAGVAPDGRASSTLPGVGRAVAPPGPRRGSGDSGRPPVIPLGLGEARRPSSAASDPRSAGSQRLRRRTAEQAALLLDSGAFPAQATPDEAPAAVGDDEITGRLHSARTATQLPSSTGTAPWVSTATLHTPSAATAPSPSAATAQLAAAEPRDEARPRPPGPPSPGLGALLGRRHPGEEPLPPVLGLVGRADPERRPASEAPAEPPPGAAPTPPPEAPAADAAPPAPEPLWLRPLPALCGVLLLLLVLLLVLLS